MDQLIGMRAFVRVVQTGNFSAAAREQNTSQATISKRVAGLESMLGVKLLTRTSRELALTEAGTRYYEKCQAILTELDEADADAREQVASPKGLLRIAAPIAIARLILSPLLAAFTKQYPEITVEIAASDKHVDLIEEGIDAAIRAKQLEDSSLIARHLDDNPMLLAASPDYIASNGKPETPEDLAGHTCIIYTNFATPNVWQFTKEAQEYSVHVNGTVRSSSGDVNLEAALNGLGIVALPHWMLKQHFESGQLVPLLPEYKGMSVPINIIYPQNRYIPLKVRCFVDFLRENFHASS
jgi:DNA-binding transcriptional LysR family regulator